MGQTVNLLVYTFGGSNPSSPTQLTITTSETYTKKESVLDSFFRFGLSKISDKPIQALSSGIILGESEGSGCGLNRG